MPVILPKCVGPLAKITSEANSHYGMNGVLFDPPNSEEGPWVLTATNGRQAAIVKGRDATPSYELRPLLAAQPPEGPGFSGLIPRDAWEEAFKRSSGEVAVFCRDDLTYNLVAGKSVTLATPGGERFPDVESVMPVRYPLATFYLCPKLLSQLCQLAVSIMGKDSSHITLYYYGPTQPVGLAARGDNLTLDAILMPMTPKGDEEVG